MDNKPTITIKKNSIGLNIVLERKNVISVMETPDGVLFQFKNGCSFRYEDDNMRSETKQKMQIADSRFQTHSVIYDLDNYRNPVLVEAN